MWAPVAMISSTVLDLPEHRAKVRDACLEAEYFPLMMESLAARDEHSVDVSVRMVDKSEVLIGVYAWRYGYVPSGHAVSITEMELERAISTGKPVLAFLAKYSQWNMLGLGEHVGEASARLATLKARVAERYTIKDFESPEDLRHHVVVALLWRRAEAQRNDWRRIAWMRQARHKASTTRVEGISMLARIQQALQTVVGL